MCVQVCVCVCVCVHACGHKCVFDVAVPLCNTVVHSETEGCTDITATACICIMSVLCSVLLLHSCTLLSEVSKHDA